MAKIQVVYSSFLDNKELLKKRCLFLEQEGFEISCLYSPESQSSWPYSYAQARKRANDFMNVLLFSQSDFYVFSRGGYGCSDLLDFLDWDRLKNLAPKTIVGFSDICALLSAFHHKLGWRALHAPMPGSSLWGQEGFEDISDLLLYFRGSPEPVSLRLDTIVQKPLKEQVAGWLFGGCLSVLSNLIATPYLPDDFSGAILFFEDVNEHPGRILRYFNQWKQANLFSGVQAIILGRLAQCTDTGLSELELKNEIGLRLDVPVYSSTAFGHCSPNYPLPLGVHACISQGFLQTRRCKELSSKTEILSVS